MTTSTNPPTTSRPAPAGDLADREAAVVAAVPKQLYVDGEWRDAAGGARFDVLDPSTGQVLCAVADASPADGRAA